jgi:hypothetical protein
VSPRERAAAAHAAAEAATHPRDKAALRAAAAAWERIAGPGVAWSLEPLARDLACLKRQVAMANGPFKAPEPPKAAPAPSVKPDIHSAAAVRKRLQERAAAGNIQF